MYRQSEKNLIFKSLHVLFAQLECDAFTSHNSAHPLTPKSTEKISYFSSQKNNSCWSTAASISKSKCFNLKLHCMIFFFFTFSHLNSPQKTALDQRLLGHCDLKSIIFSMDFGVGECVVYEPYFPDVKVCLTAGPGCKQVLKDVTECWFYSIN